MPRGESSVWWATDYEHFVRNRFLRWLFRKVTTWSAGAPMDAITLFCHTWFFIDEPAVPLVLHEQQHRVQQRRDGWRFYPRYLKWHWKYGYDENPYEIEAEKAANEEIISL